MWKCKSCENVPTCVGVYRARLRIKFHLAQCPHVRGGVPAGSSIWAPAWRMSPRAWGCTEEATHRRRLSVNVPTCVGVYRRPAPLQLRALECPHVRGGVPTIERTILRIEEMSPRAWGCTGLGQVGRGGSYNVPTCVGVYRRASPSGGPPSQCPHVRGGVPTCCGSRS